MTEQTEFKWHKAETDTPPTDVSFLVRLEDGQQAVAHFTQTGLWRLDWNDQIVEFVEEWFPLPD